MRTTQTSNVLRRILPVEVRHVPRAEVPNEGLKGKVKDPDRVLEIVGSTDHLDRYSEVIKQEGWVLKHYRPNPVFLWSHMGHEPPIGRAVKVFLSEVHKAHGKRQKALTFWIEFARAETYAFADTIFRLYKDGFLHASSVGFLPKKWIQKGAVDEDEWEKLDVPEDTVRVFTEQELLELSAVSIPANPHALINMIGEAKSRNVVSDQEADHFIERCGGTEWVEEDGVLVPARDERMKTIVRGLSLPEEPMSVENKQTLPEAVRQGRRKVQTAVFSKENWSREDAEKWLENHDLKHDKVDENDDSFRFRQFPPSECDEDSIQTITDDLPEGVSLVTCEVAEETASCPEGFCKVDGTNIRGERLAALLNRLIDAQIPDDADDEDAERARIIGEMAEAAGISASTVQQILDGEINCPPLDRLEGFARVLDSSLERLRSAAERDGCEYEDEDEEEEEESYRRSKETNEATGIRFRFQNDGVHVEVRRKGIWEEDKESVLDVLDGQVLQIEGDIKAWSTTDVKDAEPLDDDVPVTGRELKSFGRHMKEEIVREFRTEMKKVFGELAKRGGTGDPAQPPSEGKEGPDTTAAILNQIDELGNKIDAVRSV